MSLFSDNPTKYLYWLQYQIYKYKEIYDSIEYLVTLRYDWINNLPVDLFMVPMVQFDKLLRTYYIVTIDLISVFK